MRNFEQTCRKKSKAESEWRDNTTALGNELYIGLADVTTGIIEYKYN